MNYTLPSLISLAAVMLTSASASAETISFTLDGVVESDEYFPSELRSTFVTGTDVRLSMVIDLDTPYAAIFGLSNSHLTYYYAIQSVALSTSTGYAASRQITFDDPHELNRFYLSKSSDHDAITASSALEGPPVAGYAVSAFGISIYSNDTTTLDSVALTELTTDAIRAMVLYRLAFGGGGGGRIVFTGAERAWVPITLLSSTPGVSVPIPEPSTALLIGLGLVGLGRTRWH